MLSELEGKKKKWYYGRQHLQCQRSPQPLSLEPDNCCTNIAMWVVVNTSFQNQQADVIFRPRYYKLSFTAQQHLRSGICCPSLLCQLNLKSKNRASSSSLCPPLRRKQQNCWILLNSPEKAWELKTAVGGRSSYTPVIASLPKGDWNSAIDAMLMTSMSLR